MSDASTKTDASAMHRFLTRFGLGVVVVALVAVWQLATMVWAVPIYILPQPAVLLGALGRNGGTLFAGWSVTMLEASAGFLIGNVVAMAAAFLVTLSPAARAAIMPVALAIKSVPMVALTPIITLAVGFGHATVVTVVAIVCFFPTLINVRRGLQAAPAGSVDLFHILNANPWQGFWKLRLPFALPFLFTALRITAPAAIGAAMVAEYVASNSGLGYMIQDGYGRFQFVLVWQIVLITTLTTLAVFMTVAGIEARKVGRS